MCNNYKQFFNFILLVLILNLSFSDEKICRKGFFKCKNSLACIPQSKNCDGNPDCADFTDEFNCTDEIGSKYWDHLFRKNPAAEHDDHLDQFCRLPYRGVSCVCRNKDMLCQHKHLQSIPNEFLFNHQIELMDLTGNSFRVLNSNFSSHLPNRIKTLILRHCNIFQIQPNTFGNSTELESLHLDNNKINEFPKGVFAANNLLSTLILSRNELSSIDNEAFIELQQLEELDLSFNYIKEIKVEWLKPLINLRILYLNNNRIVSIKKNDLPLIPLETLSLAGNLIENVQDEVFSSLGNLENLFLSDNHIRYLRNDAFFNLSNLQSLNLNGNQMEHLESEVFANTKNLISLYLKENRLKKLPESVFQPTEKLEYIYFDKFEMCSAVRHVRVCEPKGDGISSQYHLLDNRILRSSVWIMGTVGCMGNIVVLLRRTSLRTNNIVHSLYISNLAFSDLLMSVYLFTIAIVDLYYRGVYLQYEYIWRHSVLCDICGFLSTLSCESSVLILILITWDRFMSVTQPLARKQPSKKFACIFLSSLWMLSIISALAPCLKTLQNYFGDEFYGSNGVCLSLHIHDAYQKGWEYSAILFMLFNFLALTFICYAYLRMMKEIRISNVACRKNQRNQGREKVAQRFAIIIFTDSLCWVPIIVVKFLALIGVRISEDLYAWLAILILPINSALNPILYTLTTVTFTKQIHNFTSLLTHMKTRSFDSHIPLSSINRRTTSRRMMYRATRSSFTHSKNSLKQSTSV